MKVLSWDELMPLPEADEIAGLLRAAAKCAERGYLAGASWRIADASYLLRRRMAKQGYQDAQGFDEPTGRGAFLGGDTAQLSAQKNQGQPK